MEAIKAEFSDIPADKFGIVIVGAAIHDGNDKKWIEGITESLVVNGILPEGTKAADVWVGARYTTSTGGRHDIILTAKEDAQFNIGIMAMWRLATGGDVSWIDDWKVNYADHYGFIGVRRDWPEDLDD